MRLSWLERQPSFALLGPGYGRGRLVLLTGLQPADRRPQLLFAPFELAGGEAHGFNGEELLLEQGALIWDVALPRLQVQLEAEGYVAAVQTIRELIAAGDVYQVCYTVRAALGEASGAGLFSLMMAGGLPPYSAWVRWPDGAEFVSASPELLLEMARGQLQASGKDQAELAMITDLVRNDLTPLCHPRSVRVLDPRCLVRLPYACQTVSVVAGALLPGMDVQTALRALHPGGSVTGAPKQAALQQIRRLEATPRGPYCGALCRIDLGGIESSESDGCCTAGLLIRTAFRRGDGWVYGVGSGIVYDSDPALELEELQVKLGILVDRGGGSVV